MGSRFKKKEDKNKQISKADKVYNRLEEMAYGNAKNRNEINGVISTAIVAVILIATIWEIDKSLISNMIIAFIVLAITMTMYDLFRIRSVKKKLSQPSSRKVLLEGRMGYIKAHLIGNAVVMATAVAICVFLSRRGVK